MNVSDLSGPDLDPYISKALGHIGKCEIAYHSSAHIAMMLYTKHGISIHKFIDGFYATMGNGGQAYMKTGPDPITAIYRAYIASKLGDDL